MFRHIAIAAFAATLLTSGAFAQDSTTATDNATGAAETPGVLDDAAMMKNFYTDEAMTTMRPTTEFGQAVKDLNTNDREKITTACLNVTTQHGSFCKAFNDANKM